MTFWQVLLKVLTVAAWVLAVVAIGWLCYKLLTLAVYGKSVLLTVEKFGYGWLKKKIKDLWDDVDDALDLLQIHDFCDYISSSAPVLGTAKALRAVLLALCIIFGTMGYYQFFGEGLTRFFTDFVESFPMFMFMGGIDNFFEDISLLSLISTGISAMLIGWFYRNCTSGSALDGVLSWIISIFYYIVSAVAGCFTGLALSKVWDWAAQKAVSTFNFIKDLMFSQQATFFGIVKIILCGIGLAILIYLGLWVLITALKEYLDLFCFGFASFAIVLVTALIVSQVFGNEINNTVAETIALVALVLLLLVSDYIRVFIGGIFDDAEE